jgi:hypothetical protein
MMNSLAASMMASKHYHLTLIGWDELLQTFDYRKILQYN